MELDNKVLSLGEYLRKLREVKNLTLKYVSGNLKIDPSLLAKIERNERAPSKELIKKLSLFFHCDERLLTNIYLSDFIANKIFDEEADLSILNIVEKKVKNLTKTK